MVVITIAIGSLDGNEVGMDFRAHSMRPKLDELLLAGRIELALKPLGGETQDESQSERWKNLIWALHNARTWPKPMSPKTSSKRKGRR